MQLCIDASAIIPGIGQFYNGRILAGILWLIITPGFWIGSAGLFGWPFHLIAELLDNATSFSPPDSQVVMSTARTGDGSIVVSLEETRLAMREMAAMDYDSALGAYLAHQRSGHQQRVGRRGARRPGRLR